jgi:uncharacterized protein with LGFP repeats
MADQKWINVCRRGTQAAVLMASLVGSSWIEVRAECPTPALDRDPAIEAKYEELSGALGMLGQAVNRVQRTFDGEGRYRAYENGFIYWHPSSGAHVVRGAIRTRWGVLGAEMGVLGYPTSDEEPLPGGDGRMSRFQHGEIVWRESSGIVSVRESEATVPAVAAADLGSAATR